MGGNTLHCTGKGYLLLMENRKQKRWPFHLALKKTSVIILVVSLLSLSAAFAATAHYFGLALPFTPTHPAGTAFNPEFQQTGAGNSEQPAIAASSANVTVDFAKRLINTYPIPSTFLGVGGVGLKLIVRNNSDGNAIRQANFRLTKLGDYDFMSQI